MFIRRAVVLGLGAAVLAACANVAAQQAMVARTALVGLPKTTLLSCAGVPERQMTLGPLDYFTYRTSRVVSYPMPGWGGGGGWGWRHGRDWGGPGTIDDVRSYTCEATFTLRDGAVEQVTYSGAPGDGGNLALCAAIVQNCLSLVAPPPAATAPAEKP
jgi:hypothetical protein